jgi:hypothetical protein
MMPDLPTPGMQRITLHMAFRNRSKELKELRGEEFYLVPEIGEDVPPMGAVVGEAQLEPGQTFHRTRLQRWRSLPEAQRHARVLHPGQPPERGGSPGLSAGAEDSGAGAGRGGSGSGRKPGGTVTLLRRRAKRPLGALAPRARVRMGGEPAGKLPTGPSGPSWTA